MQMGNPRKVNCSKQFDGLRIKVMCPVCNAAGAQYLYSYQPKCHVCTDTVMMLPASNNQCECSWAEAQEYFIKHKESK